MTPQEALDLIDKLLAEVNTSRAGHDKIREAVQVIKIKLSPDQDPQELETKS